MPTSPKSATSARLSCLDTSPRPRRPTVSQTGSSGAWSTAQVMRLAALYAVMGESHKIERQHLLAALALWDYAEKSALYIFGHASGDPVADRIYNALRAAGKDGMTRTEISHLFGRNRSSERIAQALSL